MLDLRFRFIAAVFNLLPHLFVCFLEKAPPDEQVRQDYQRYKCTGTWGPLECLFLSVFEAMQTAECPGIPKPFPHHL